MIDKLTAAQEELLQDVHDEWVAHGLSTAPADRPAVEQAMREVYSAAGLTPPRFVIWLDSPWAGTVGQAVAPEIAGEALRSRHGRLDVAVEEDLFLDLLERGNAAGDQMSDQLWDHVHDQVHDGVLEQSFELVNAQVNDQATAPVDDAAFERVFVQVSEQAGGQVRKWVPGQVDGWVYANRLREWGDSWSWLDEEHYETRYLCYCAHFDAMERLGITGLEPAHGLQQVVRNSGGWWWCFDDFAILADRPAELHRDRFGRLHCETGPAVRYRDGWGFHAWRGRRVPEWVVLNPTVEQIVAEQNVEVRRCGIESLGWAQFIVQAQLTLVDSGSDPGNAEQKIALYDVPERLWGEGVRVLLCTNGTAERDGTRRRFGLTVPREISTALDAAGWSYGLTGSEYATAQRRA